MIKFRTEALDYAALSLRGNAFKIWCYIHSIWGGGDFILSPADAMEFTGINSRATYDRAIKELMEVGYLKKVKRNRYSFSDMPIEE